MLHFISPKSCCWQVEALFLEECADAVRLANEAAQRSEAAVSVPTGLGDPLGCPETCCLSPLPLR